VIEAVEKSPNRDRTTVLVVSDHGFRGAEKAIRPNAVLRGLGLVTGQSPDLTCAAWAVTAGGTAGLYVTEPARREELLPRIGAALAATEGVERVMTPDEFASLGWPRPEESDQVGDLVLVAKDGYEFSREDTGEAVVPVDPTHRGHHGVLASDPRMDALFIAWGAEVRPGVRLEAARTLDVAPTIAEWLGVQLAGMEGRSIAGELR
jgi:arylsulfatase A-like enzyme